MATVADREAAEIWGGQSKCAYYEECKEGNLCEAGCPVTNCLIVDNQSGNQYVNLLKCAAGSCGSCYESCLPGG